MQMIAVIRRFAPDKDIVLVDDFFVRQTIVVILISGCKQMRNFVLCHFTEILKKDIENRWIMIAIK